LQKGCSLPVFPFPKWMVGRGATWRGKLSKHSKRRDAFRRGAFQRVLEKSLVIVREKIKGVSQLALARFLTKARRVIGSGQVDVLITSNDEIQALNRRFRHNNKPTDVLSFPSPPECTGLSGDIVVSADIAGENAERLGHALNNELKVLVLHGLLHLAGYDHETDDDGAMAREEARLRKQLGLPQSLIERAQRSAEQRRRARVGVEPPRVRSPRIESQ
jgi:probable rRNA maturation factor